MRTPLEFAAFLMAAAAEIEHEQRKSLEKAAVMLETDIKDAIGTYRYGWEPLQPETIARKATGDSPLLEDGTLRDSISHEIDGDVAYVGTNDPVGKYHEFGTIHIPPRPFFEGAIDAKKAEIEHEFGRMVMKVFGQTV